METFLFNNNNNNNNNNNKNKHKNDTRLNENGIEYMGFCKKPFKKYFINAANKMGLDPENVLVIGDDIICDIYGGNRCGMITAIVKDVVNRDDFER